MHLFDHFDFLASIYEAFIKPKYPKEVWALANLPVSGVLLVACGGPGRIAQFIPGEANPIVVADLSFKMLSGASQKDSLSSVCTHTERLPFADKAVTSIIMVDALHHDCDQRETVDELWHALQPGGRLVIEEPDVRTFAVKLIALAKKLALMCSRFLTSPSIAGLFHYPNVTVRIETNKTTT